ncbi:ASCH domain-containing protein [Brevibacterium spongiae]|uniref:ASCH domain-containing protein n=2 Tax=Brevibacterium spongiae TaxID=2909672 RepID=A0ABY5STR1_9MICO|nr:ASCH domain-containing protein [Brevibacterium spongiae]UVI37932.1 ASCH domain-containing protein [Brevibacterium spongiae]
MNSQLEDFWSTVKHRLQDLPEQIPEAWAFGATPEHADELLALVLNGTKTGTASALWDIEDEGEAVPAVGELSIILDGRSRPRALIETTAIDIVPFSEVTAEHAHSEGEGDRTLADWREIHERFWREHGSRGYSAEMPVVCERFRLLFPVGDAHGDNAASHTCGEQRIDESEGETA